VGITYGIRHLLYIEVEAHGDQGRYMEIEAAKIESSGIRENHHVIRPTFLDAILPT
jgi:hypothetical protein